MPHSSYPLDDIRALSFYRGHGFPPGESRGRLGGVGSVRKHLQFSLLSEMSVCLMDTFLLYDILSSCELKLFSVFTVIENGMIENFHCGTAALFAMIWVNNLIVNVVAFESI